MGLVAITWQKPAPTGDVAAPRPTSTGENAIVPGNVSILIRSRLTNVVVHGQLNSLFRSDANNIGQNASAHHHRSTSKPVESSSSLLSADGLEAIPRTLVLHRASGLSLPIREGKRAHLETSLDHIQRVNNGSTNDTSNTTDNQLLDKGNLHHHHPSVARTFFTSFLDIAQRATQKRFLMKVETRYCFLYAANNRGFVGFEMGVGKEGEDD